MIYDLCNTAEIGRPVRILDANGLEWFYTLACDTETGAIYKQVIKDGALRINPFRQEIVKEVVYAAAPLLVLDVKSGDPPLPSYPILIDGCTCNGERYYGSCAACLTDKHVLDLEFDRQRNNTEYRKGQEILYDTRDMLRMRPFRLFDAKGDEWSGGIAFDLATGAIHRLRRIDGFFQHNPFEDEVETEVVYAPAPLRIEFDSLPVRREKVRFLNLRIVGCKCEPGVIGKDCRACQTCIHVAERKIQLRKERESVQYHRQEPISDSVIVGGGVEGSFSKYQKTP